MKCATGEGCVRIRRVDLMGESPMRMVVAQRYESESLGHCRRRQRLSVGQQTAGRNESEPVELRKHTWVPTDSNKGKALASPALSKPRE